MPGPEGGADSGPQERSLHPPAGEQPPQTGRAVGGEPADLSHLVGGPHLRQQRLLRAGRVDGAGGG